eukprot:TRINITY_DN2844_c0_g1_i2.p1 TRINITY_DN2844_c0_g1~~TRINITY_DN2844_c0_g1_i2.p1  ORF type:complete len:223 (+),score=64.47 TRINITY_DN2844_c0_g1_i2:73-741(+)
MGCASTKSANKAEAGAAPATAGDATLLVNGLQTAAKKPAEAQAPAASIESITITAPAVEAACTTVGDSSSAPAPPLETIKSAEPATTESVEVAAASSEAEPALAETSAAPAVSDGGSALPLGTLDLSLAASVAEDTTKSKESLPTDTMQSSPPPPAGSSELPTESIRAPSPKETLEATDAALEAGAISEEVQMKTVQNRSEESRENSVFSLFGFCCRPCIDA